MSQNVASYKTLTMLDGIPYDYSSMSYTHSYWGKSSPCTNSSTITGIGIKSSKWKVDGLSAESFNRTFNQPNERQPENEEKNGYFFHPPYRNGTHNYKCVSSCVWSWYLVCVSDNKAAVYYSQIKHVRLRNFSFVVCICGKIQTLNRGNTYINSMANQRASIHTWTHTWTRRGCVIDIV